MAVIVEALQTFFMLYHFGFLHFFFFFDLGVYSLGNVHNGRIKDEITKFMSENNLGFTWFPLLNWFSLSPLC